MRAKGLLIALLLGVVIVYFLWLGKSGKKSQVETAVDRLQQAKVELTRTNMAQLAKAIQIYLSSEERLPENLKELQSKGIMITSAVDSWGKAIKYEKVSETDYRLISAGKDRLFDTEDDILQDY